jgi:predicted dehydrogenase
MIGIVIAGTGFGCLTHVPAFRAAGFEVRALVGRDPEKTAERAALLGVPHALTSFTRALALPGVDAVSIATPPHTHAALVGEAAAAGKHMVCEKPFAAETAQAQEMLAAAERAGVIHLLGTEFRFATGQALLRRAVADGAIGEPRLATFLLHVPLLADPEGEVPGWWGAASEGGGWLGAQGSHVLDQIRAALGEIEGVSASLGRLADRETTAEDTFTVHFRTATASGVAQSTVASWGRLLMETRISGSRGSLWLQGEKVWLADAAGTRCLDVPADLRNPAPVPPRPEFLRTPYDMLHFTGMDLAPYTRLAAVLRARILGEPVPDDPAAATFADGVAEMRVLDAIRASAPDGAWVVP